MEQQKGQRLAFVTSSLIIAFTGVAVLIIFLNAAKVVDFLQLALDQEQISAGPFLICPFVHENFLHLALMMLFLAVPGADLESRLGRISVLIIAVGGTYVGNLTWLIIPSGYALIGAAGAVNALWTTYVVLHFRQISTWILIAVWGGAIAVHLPVDDTTFDTTPISLLLGSSLWGALVALDAVWRRKVPLATDVLGLWPRIKRVLNYLFPPTEAPTQPAAVQAVSARENASRLSASLQQRLAAAPEDLALNQQALEAMLVAKAPATEIARQGRIVLRLLLRENKFVDAFDGWWRLNQRLGFFEAPPDDLIRLIKDRLAQNEWSQASELVLSLQKVDPHHVLLPDQMQNLIRLIAVQRGAQSEQAQRWLRTFEAQYPKHPSIDALRRELNTQGQAEQAGGIELSSDTQGAPLTASNIQQNAAPRPGSSGHIQTFKPVSLEDEVQTVQDLLYAGNTYQAAEILTRNQALIGQFDPLILYDAAQRLMANPQSRAKGVFLIELTVRGHLNHPNTPQLVTGLITAYCRDLSQPALARQWLNYMRERWPNDPALDEARAIVEEG